jgi:hypothetical protein
LCHHGPTKPFLAQHRFTSAGSLILLPARAHWSTGPSAQSLSRVAFSHWMVGPTCHLYLFPLLHCFCFLSASTTLTPCTDLSLVSRGWTTSPTPRTQGIKAGRAPLRTRPAAGGGGCLVGVRSCCQAAAPMAVESSGKPPDG